MKQELIWLPAALVGFSSSRWMWTIATRSAVRDRLIDGGLHPHVGGRGTSSVGRWVESSLRNAEVHASPREAAGFVMIAAAGGALVSAAIDLRLAVIVCLGIVGAAPMTLFAMRGRALRRASTQLPSLLRRVATELRAGGTVPSAFAAIAAEPAAVNSGLLMHDCRAVSKRVSYGAGMTEALETWAAERDLAGVRAASGSLILAAEVGGPAADALEGLASSLAARTAASEETRAQSAQARASALVMITAPIGYLVFSSSIDQRSTDVLFGSAVGRSCLTAGILLDVAAALWIRFLLRDRFGS